MCANARPPPVCLIVRAQELSLRVMALVNHAATPGHSHFVLQTLQQEVVHAMDDLKYKQLERDVRLARVKVNLDTLLDKTTLAIRGLPQTAVLEMQAAVQRRLNIAIALTNPTLPPGAADTGERLFARKSIIF